GCGQDQNDSGHDQQLDEGEAADRTNGPQLRNPQILRSSNSQIYWIATVSGRNCRPIGVPPGPVAVPLTEMATLPGARASNSSALSRPVPDAPVASAERVMVMSTRPGLTCCVKTAFTPPDRMKLPSLTARTRSSDGSKVIVSATVERREAFVTEIGT